MAVVMHIIVAARRTSIFRAFCTIARKRSSWGEEYSWSAKSTAPPRVSSDTIRRHRIFLAARPRAVLCALATRTERDLAGRWYLHGVCIAGWNRMVSHRRSCDTPQ